LAYNATGAITLYDEGSGQFIPQILLDNQSVIQWYDNDGYL